VNLIPTNVIASINLDDFPNYSFESRQQYEASTYSRKYYEECMSQNKYCNWIFDEEPSRFPCIGISLGDEERHNGPDRIQMMWFYPDANGNWSNK
jgi:hypothetical protein